MSCEDEIGSTREIFDDLGGLGVPAQPDDFLVLGLRNDVGLFPAHVPQEGIGVIVGHVDTRSVRDAQHSVVSVAPDWRVRGVVTGHEGELSVNNARTDVDVAALDLSRTFRHLLVI